MEDLARQLAGRIQAVDFVALADGVRIAAGSEHDTERGARVPFRIGAIQLAVERGVAEYRQV